jgi:hypothetical protein
MSRLLVCCMIWLLLVACEKETTDQRDEAITVNINATVNLWVCADSVGGNYQPSDIQATETYDIMIAFALNNWENICYWPDEMLTGGTRTFPCSIQLHQGEYIIIHVGVEPPVNVGDSQSLSFDEITSSKDSTYNWNPVFNLCVKGLN